jgi:hypothetical protein
MMHGGLSVGEPSLLEITDNQNSMGAADRQLQPIPSLILNNFFDRRENPLLTKRTKETMTSHNVRILIKICGKINL